MQARAAARMRWLVFAAILLGFILVPFLVVEAPFTRWLAQLFQELQGSPVAAGALVVALLGLDPLLPIPSSLVSVVAGAAFGLQLAALLIWAGMTLGAILGYALGASAGRGLARRLVGPGELVRAHRLAADIGPATLVITRAVPVLSEAAAMVAGTARMPLWLFLLSTTAANAVIAIAYAAVGDAAGSQGSFLIAFMGLVLLPALGWSAWRLLARRGDVR